MTKKLKILLLSFCIVCPCQFILSQQDGDKLDIPDKLITTAYEKAASQNVLAAVNSKVFFGYFSVCADGLGFGYGNTYPSLDGHQMTDALLWLGQIEVVKANWSYVKTFQKSKGELPIAIIPDEAGKNIGPVGFQSKVDSNGGLYRHWVPGDPLRALAGTTYIQNADVIFRFTQDVVWLKRELPSINLTADYLTSMITAAGAVAGAGYYVERPTRVEFDGVSQCHVAEAFYRLVELNRIAGNLPEAAKFKKLADLVKLNFQKNFWVRDHFAEYIHPQRGIIASHGLTDVDWSAIATGLATPSQTATLWPQLEHEKLFYYNGMPTGIATRPGTYQKWETTYADNQDLAAMGRVWYIESWARANMHDGKGLTETLRRVSQEGLDSGWYWRERYNDKGGYGALKYNEYPANLIRIVQRFLLGIEHGNDGTLFIAPTAPDEFWRIGFGQKLTWANSHISYKMLDSQISGNYSGKKSQKLAIRFRQPASSAKLQALVNGKLTKVSVKNGWINFLIPGTTNAASSSFELKQL